MTKRIAFAVIALMAAASQALAADNGGSTVPNRKPAPAAPVNQPPEIKHGVYTEFDFGVLAYLGGDAAKNNNAGVMAGFAIGADVGPYVKVEARMLNATNDGNGTLYPDPGAPAAVVSKYPCPTDPTTACAQAPDVQASLISGGVKLAYPTSERLNLHGMFAVGVMLGNPAPEQIFKFSADDQLQKPNDVSSGSTPIIGFGGGIEYYTHLRHFSVGADGEAWVAGSTGGLMFTLFPTIKYTF